MFEKSGPTTGNGLGCTPRKRLLDFLNGLDFSVVVPNRLAHDDEEGLTAAGFVPEPTYFHDEPTNYFDSPNNARRATAGIQGQGSRNLGAMADSSLFKLNVPMF